MPDILVWLYNSHTGAVQNLPRGYADLLLKAGIGWHGPFKTKEEALKYYEDNKAANPGWAEPTGWRGNLGNAPSAAGQVIQNVSDPFKGLNLGSWLVRIAEIIIGAILVGVGVAKLTGASNLISKGLKVAIP